MTSPATEADRLELLAALELERFGVRRRVDIDAPVFEGRPTENTRDRPFSLPRSP